MKVLVNRATLLLTIRLVPVVQVRDRI